jgi:hypothetical protein
MSIIRKYIDVCHVLSIVHVKDAAYYKRDRSLLRCTHRRPREDTSNASNRSFSLISRQFSSWSYKNL